LGCSETPSIPNIKLNNGQEIPQLGLGTWKAEKEKIAEVTELALHVGYRQGGLSNSKSKNTIEIRFF
jgi:hypothetical protein